MQADEGKGAEFPTVHGKVMHFDPQSGLMRITVSKEIDRGELKQRLESGKPVIIEIVQPG